MHTLSVRCSYRARAYSNDDINQLKSDLEDIAVVQARSQGYPEAGGDAELSLVVQFIGSTVIGGLIWDGIKILSKGLFDLYNRKKNSGSEPEVSILELRFDDVDIRLRGNDLEHGMECNCLSQKAFEYLPEITKLISEHLSSEPLRSVDKQVVDIFEPDIVASDGVIQSMDFNLAWRLEGVDVMAPKAYNASQKIVIQDYEPLDEWL